MQKGHIYIGLNCLCVQWLLTQRTSSASGKSVIVQEEEREGEEGRGGRERDISVLLILCVQHCKSLFL
jgi:hypothetical protein